MLPLLILVFSFFVIYINDYVNDNTPNLVTQFISHATKKRGDFSGIFFPFKKSFEFINIILNTEKSI